MAVTIDTRPTYFGDRMIVTGSYAAYAAVSAPLHDTFTFSGSTITVNPPFAGMDTAGGTFLAIGRRS